MPTIPPIILAIIKDNDKSKSPKTAQTNFPLVLLNTSFSPPDKINWYADSIMINKKTIPPATKIKLNKLDKSVLIPAPPEPMDAIGEGGVTSPKISDAVLARYILI